MIYFVAALAAVYLWIKLGQNAAALNADDSGGFTGTGGTIDPTTRIPTTLSDGTSGYIDNLGAIWDSMNGGKQIGGITDSPRPGGDSQVYDWGDP